MYNRIVSLALVLVLIVGAIWYIESHKASRGQANPNAASVTTTATSGKALMYPLAKELSDPAGFINTNGAPITLSSFVGHKVVLLDFWTYSCINCQRTLPYLEAWYDKYKEYGLEIVGVHSPEFEFEKVYDNVVAAVKKYGISYPVVLDSNYGTWNAYSNQYWPSEYLIDIDGYVVKHDIGEGNYAEMEAAIQKALEERSDRLNLGLTIPSGISNPKGAVTSIAAESPETYFGSARNQYLGNGARSQTGEKTYVIPATLNPNTLYLGGTWDMQDEYAKTISATSTVIYRYSAKDVYLVAGASTPIKVTVKKDGVIVQTITIEASGLYPLISDPTPGVHTLELDIVGKGLEAFTFTFG